MSVRALWVSLLARFCAVLLVALALSPVTQPFATLGVSDFLEERSRDAASADDVKATLELATVGPLLTVPADHAVAGEATDPARSLTIERHSSPIVLRI